MLPALAPAGRGVAGRPLPPRTHKPGGESGGNRSTGAAFSGGARRRLRARAGELSRGQAGAAGGLSRGEAAMAGGSRWRGEAVLCGGLAVLLCALRECRPGPVAGEQLPVGLAGGGRLPALPAAAGAGVG